MNKETEGSGLLDRLTAPLMDAVAGVTSVATAAIEGVTSVVALEPARQAPFNEDALRLIVYQLWHGDSRLQQRVLGDHFSRDAVFRAGTASSVFKAAGGGRAHERRRGDSPSPSGRISLVPQGQGQTELEGQGGGDGSGGGSGNGAATSVGADAEVVSIGESALLVEVRGQEAMAGVLMGCQLLARVTPEITSVAIEHDRALILATLKIAWLLIPLTWWRPVRSDTLILMRFGDDAKISDMAHIGSWASGIWFPLWQNALVDWLLRALWLPRSGRMLLSLVKWARQLARIALEVLARGENNSKLKRGAGVAAAAGSAAAPSGSEGQAGGGEEPLTPQPPLATDRGRASSSNGAATISKDSAISRMRHRPLAAASAGAQG